MANTTFKIAIVCSLAAASCVSETLPAQAKKSEVRPETTSTDPKTEKALKDHVQAYADRGEFSGAVLVAKGGTILFKGAFGLADVEKKIPNKVDTRFLVGSTTKSLTATVLLRYRDRGLVDLHEPLTMYLPKLRKDLAERLTLDLLLRMKSGLPNHLARLTAIDERQITTDEIISVINTAKLSYEPGTAYSYSNLNYTLIAAILEEISGKPFADVLEEELFGPLNMDDSGSGSFEGANRALGYHVNSLERAQTNNLSYALGSGSVYSTVEDIYKWDQALYKDSFVSENSRRLAFTGGSEEFGFYGYGFRIREYERPDASMAKGRLVRHGGTMQGYLSNVHRFLDDRTTVIVLGNISMFPIRKLTTELKEIAFGHDPPRNVDY